MIKQRHLLHYLPVIVFFLIAANHFYLVKTAHLTPWLGGGYGMFSTTDYGPSRFIKVYGVKNSVIQEDIEIPEQLSMLARKVRGLPDNKNVGLFAEAIASYLQDNQHSFPVIRIEVLTTQYQPETLRPTYHKLNMIDHQVDLVQ